MDVEKLKKINMLANTLRVHGIAATRDDAADLAGKLTGTSEEVRFTDIVEKPVQRVVIEKEETTMEPKNKFSEEQIIKILQAFADQFSAEINRLNSKVEEQSRQIAKLSVLRQSQSDNVVVNTSGGMQMQQQAMQGNGHEQQAVVMQAPAQQQRPAQQHPRSGGFNPSDVAIDKIFYFGNK